MDPLTPGRPPPVLPVGTTVVTSGKKIPDLVPHAQELKRWLRSAEGIPSHVHLIQTW